VQRRPWLSEQDFISGMAVSQILPGANITAPLGTGLMAAGILAIFKTAGAGPLSWAVALGSAVLLGMLPKLHPLLLLAAGGIIFVASDVLGATMA
jgi:chromate transport protein ChrA